MDNEQYSETDHRSLLSKYGYKYHKKKGKYIHPDGHQVRLNGNYWDHKNTKQSTVFGNTVQGLAKHLKREHSTQHAEELPKPEVEENEQLPSVKKRLSIPKQGIRKHTYLEHLKAGGKPKEGGIAY